MRFVSFVHRSVSGWGRVVDDRVQVLTTQWPTLLDALTAGALAAVTNEPDAGPWLMLREITLEPVIPNPRKILCVGLNYETHRQETGRPKPTHPTIFTRFADSQASAEGPMLLPSVSYKFDYEGELAVIIGQAGRAIAADNALGHIAGYSCYNDGSIRDWQGHTAQFTPGKNFPRTGAFGPWLVTPDEFGPPVAQRIQTRLNGELMQDALIEQMIFSVAQIIEYCSTFTPLSPGDVIVTGTPGGVGFTRDPPRYMKVGDRIEVEIEHIGILRNIIESAD